MDFLKNLFNHEYKELKKFTIIADKIDALDDSMQKLSDKRLQDKTLEFKDRFKKGESLEELMVEAYAVVREVSFRTVGLKPFYVQLLGAIAIHYGNIAEMKTGEGKTLV